MNVVKTNQKGFSIIEVVLVLAIAGLIFLMVFVALPALQRSQRDQARRSDVGVVGSAISSYASNNRGKLPTSTADLRQYVDNLSAYDKTTELVLANGIAGDPTANQIRAHIGAKCNTAPGATAGSVVAGTSRQAAVRVVLEGSGNKVFCQDV